MKLNIKNQVLGKVAALGIFLSILSSVKVAEAAQIISEAHHSKTFYPFSAEATCRTVVNYGNIDLESAPGYSRWQFTIQTHVDCQDVEMRFLGMPLGNIGTISFDSPVEQIDTTYNPNVGTNAERRASLRIAVAQVMYGGAKSAFPVGFGSDFHDSAFATLAGLAESAAIFRNGFAVTSYSDRIRTHANTVAEAVFNFVMGL